MKKALFFSVFAAVLLFSCQRENSSTVTTSGLDNLPVSSRGPCMDINIDGGDGLGLCGVPAGAGTTQCDLCGTLSNDIIIVGASAVYTLDGNDAFALYNFDPVNDVTVRVYFNCDATAVNILVPADSKVFYKIDVDANGCCFAVPNPGPC